MEEKIYERQIMKQSISYRVVDELHTARHFKETELATLYKFEPNKKHENNLTDVKVKLFFSHQHNSRYSQIKNF